MDILEIFIVICTVVLLSSWGFIIYSNYKSKSSVIQFPPYGYDNCPIGTNLNPISGKCNYKLKHYLGDSDINPVEKNAAAGQAMTSREVCSFFNEYNKEDSKHILAWDGLPTSSTHRYPENNKVYQLLSECCDSTGKNSCNSLDFSRLINEKNEISLDE